MYNIRKIYTILIFIILIIIFYRIFNTSLIDKFENINEPKIAFLFLTYNNLKSPDIWNKFLDIKYNNKFTIYNHAKEPENVTDSLLKNKQIPEHIDTCWGCANLVEANILLLKNALKDPLNKKFILISDSCIPIVSFNNFYNEIMKDNNSRINIHTSNIDRYDNIINPPFLKTEFIKHSGSGLVVNVKHAEILVSQIDNLKQNWQNVSCLDEHFFGNILKTFDTNFNDSITIAKTTFDIWSRKKLNIDNICNNNQDNKNANVNNDTICEEHSKYMISPTIIKNLSNKMIDELRDKKFLLIRKIDKNANIDINYLLN